jgi:hypothetical protein
MKSIRRGLLTVVPVLGLLLLHHALMRWLAAENVVASILSAGEHTPGSTLMLAAFFVALRLFVLLVLPGLLLCRLGLWVFDRAVEAAARPSRGGSPPHDPPP